MATLTLIESHRLAGSSDSLSLPVFVYDDGEASLDIGPAILAAEAAAPATLIGLVQDGVPSVQRLNSYALRVTVNYAIQTFTPFETDDRHEFEFHAEAMEFDFAEQVARFPAAAMDYGGVVYPGGWPDGRQGGFQPAPRANRRYRFRVNVATVTANWVRTAGNLVGRVNSAALTSGAYPIGTTMLTDLVGTQVSVDEFELTVGWAYRPNVTGETRGSVTGVEYQGHDFVWEVHAKKTDRNGNTLYREPKAVYVSRPRPSADLSALGVSPA